MMKLADQLRGEREEGSSTDARTLAQRAATWRNRGVRAFEAHKEASAAEAEQERMSWHACAMLLSATPALAKQPIVRRFRRARRVWLREES